MSRIQIVAISVIVAAFSLFTAPQVHAVQRTHVSAAFGSDSNTATNCTAAAPCRFFQAAMTVTDTDGEVVVLDSGGYGAVTITKSLSLIAPTGVYAGISVFPGADGVTIATPGVNVVLRGISINSQGGNNGINMTAGASLTVENCVITNFSSIGTAGILVSIAASVGVRDTALRGNNIGIYVLGGATAIVARTTVAGIAGSGFGIFVYNLNAGITTSAAITDSTFSGGQVGIFGRSEAANANVRVSVIRSTIAKNSFGIQAQSFFGAPSVVTVSETMVTNNGTGLVQSGTGAVLESLGNNTVRQNTTATTGTITTVAPL